MVRAACRVKGAVQVETGDSMSVVPAEGVSRDLILGDDALLYITYVTLI